MNGGESSGAAQIRLELSPCRGFAAIILAVHLAAAGCLLAVLPGWQGIALAALLSALGAASARDRALLRGAHAPRAIEIQGPGKALLVLANGQTGTAAPVHGIGVTRHWVALKGGAPARWGVLVTAGMLDSGRFRLLRLWALWGKVRGVAPGQRPA